MKDDAVRFSAVRCKHNQRRSAMKRCYSLAAFLALLYVTIGNAQQYPFDGCGC